MYTEKKLGNSTSNLNNLEWRQNIGLFFSGHFRKKESKCALEPQEAKIGTGNESVYRETDSQAAADVLFA